MVALREVAPLLKEVYQLLAQVPLTVVVAEEAQQFGCDLRGHLRDQLLI